MKPRFPRSLRSRPARRAGVRRLLAAAGLARAARPGFTIVEMLVAVGAVTLIAIGIAKVFATTGDTVRVGRRLSALNEYAALIERQFREDFGAITRDGFLVVRNRLEGPARLWADDPDANGRMRRVDEIVFFARGSFTSLRDPVAPGRTAVGPAARIYYGHGLQWGPDARPTGGFEVDLQGPNDRYDDSIEGPVDLVFGEGPNRYAGDWTLLRHATVLAQPQLTASAGAPPREQDSEVQIALMPAAASIFRGLRPASPPSQWSRTGDAPPGGNETLRFECGGIDVATTDLAEIRATVLDAQRSTYRSGGAASVFRFDKDGSSTDDGPLAPTAFQYDRGTAYPQTANMHDWMRRAFPSDLPEDPEDPDVRVRYELTPPDLMGTRTGGGATRNADRDYRRADQSMLTASNFVPHCTEFIVEWSFGDAVRPDDNHASADNGATGRWGDLIWHGMFRAEDVDGDGASFNVGSPEDEWEWAARPYLGVGVADLGTELVDRHTLRVPSRFGGTLSWPVKPELIHGKTADVLIGDMSEHAEIQHNGVVRRSELCSYFGFLDPTMEGPDFDPPVDPRFTPDSVPWAWPKLIRVTMKLVDPSEPGLEKSYQFIFEVPSGERSGL